MKKIIFCFAFILLIGFLSCKKEDPCQDCYKNIFHCKINGQYWEPYCEPDPLFGCNPISIQYYEDVRFLEMTISNKKIKNGFRMVIRKLDPNINNPFEFDNSIYANNTLTVNCIVYDVDTSAESYLKIESINYQSRTMKAKFNLKAINLCQDTVKVTEGYFELRLRY